MISYKNTNSQYLSISLQITDRHKLNSDWHWWRRYYTNRWKSHELSFTFLYHSPLSGSLGFLFEYLLLLISFANGKMAVISRNYLAKCKNLKTKSFDLPCFFLITPWKLPAYNVALLWDKYLLLKLFHI